MNLRIWLLSFWRGIKTLWHRVTSNIEKTMPQLLKRFRGRRFRQMVSRRRTLGTNLRENIMHAYLSTLDIAQEKGVGRKNTQTPYEYNTELEPQLEDTAETMSQLTEYFVKARYSQQSFTESTLNLVFEKSKIVQEKLREIDTLTSDQLSDTDAHGQER